MKLFPDNNRGSERIRFIEFATIAILVAFSIGSVLTLISNI
jgi:hypothetical protein